MKSKTVKMLEWAPAHLAAAADLSANSADDEISFIYFYQGEPVSNNKIFWCYIYLTDKLFGLK